jgi:hypothetical protein
MFGGLSIDNEFSSNTTAEAATVSVGLGSGSTAETSSFIEIASFINTNATVAATLRVV